MRTFTPLLSILLGAIASAGVVHASTGPQVPASQPPLASASTSLLPALQSLFAVRSASVPVGTDAESAPSRSAGPPEAVADAADAAPDAARVTAEIQRTYEALEDFRADFVQEYENPVLGDTRRSEGRVFFSKPGKMRWDYRTPTERFLISDGRTLWVYEPEFAQYYTQSLADSQLPLALRFLMGEGQLEEAFEISLREVREDGRISLRLVPRRSEGQLRELHFLVDPEHWEVVETTVIDPLGHINRITFRNVRRNTGLPASGFRFEPPEGTHRVSAPGE